MPCNLLVFYILSTLLNFFFVFFALGSVVAFFLPMLVMVNTYVLTIRLLRRKAKHCKEVAQQQQPAPALSSPAQPALTNTISSTVAHPPNSLLPNATTHPSHLHVPCSPFGAQTLPTARHCTATSGTISVDNY